MVTLRIVIVILFIYSVLCQVEDSFRIVQLDDGDVRGEKFWDGEFYEFFGVPYATAPTGRDRFKAPLPVRKRDEVLIANDLTISCQQTFYTGEEDEEIFLTGQEDCLSMNILVPAIANKSNLLPVLVYIHSGAFAGGSASMGKLHNLARRDVVAISINYRLGAIGFACLGTEDIPGNAGLKDQLAALKWINKNIENFGGDPDKVTLAGFSVGAAMAELLAISKHTDGLIDKLILESGSALGPYAINRHPVDTARNVAISLGFNNTGNIKDLNEFYLNAEAIDLASRSLNFFIKNSTFGFAPCIENTKDNPAAFLTESPLDIFKNKGLKNIAVLTGFANMEGLSRTDKFHDWSEMMNENFSDFLPADLKFKDKQTRNEIVSEIYRYYFQEEEVTHDNKQAYVDYFSDSMFKYSIMKSVKMFLENPIRSVYVYEFFYVGELNMKHIFMDTIKGASHRDQTSYLWDFYGFTNSLNDLDARDRMTYLWTDFVKYGNPTAFESLLITVKWQKYTNESPEYLSIGEQLEMKRGLFAEKYEFWDDVYQKHYWNPISAIVDESK